MIYNQAKSYIWNPLITIKFYAIYKTNTTNGCKWGGFIIVAHILLLACVNN